MTISSISSYTPSQAKDCVPSMSNVRKISLIAINIIGQAAICAAMGGTIGSWLNRSESTVIPCFSTGMVCGTGLGVLFGLSSGLHGVISSPQSSDSLTTQVFLIGSSALTRASGIAVIGAGVGYVTGLGTLNGMGLGATYGLGKDLFDTVDTFQKSHLNA